MNKIVIDQLNIQLPAGWEGQAHALARMVSERIHPANQHVNELHIPTLQLGASSSLPDTAQQIANSINQQLASRHPGRHS